jgi:hypothetical protein
MVYDKKQAVFAKTLKLWKQFIFRIQNVIEQPYQKGL